MPPDLISTDLSSNLSLSCCPNAQSVTDSADSAHTVTNLLQTLATTIESCDLSLGTLISQLVEKCNSHGIKVFQRKGKRNKEDENGGKVLDDYVEAWFQKKKESGVSVSKWSLPFLVGGAPRMAHCLACDYFIDPGEEVLCSVHSCKGVYHLKCVKEKLGISVQGKFKCPQHACYTCSRQRVHWRCVRCTIASHDKCAPWPEDVTHLRRYTARAICWRHPTDWRKVTKHDVPATEIEEIFCRLPLPYVQEEFKIDSSWKEAMENKVEEFKINSSWKEAMENKVEEIKIDSSWKEAMENRAEPPPYTHIRRNVYQVKKKRDNADDGIGCSSCSSIVCSNNCVCRVQYISCSKACHCPETCTNRPFRKEKKTKVVMTEHCGWGVVAAESIYTGDFVIEYIGEVIDDALCEKRLWDMKYKGETNFYMCEIKKDFTIDATFKGNASRFLNHSCDPNCLLEKWQVDGETRVGVFAARTIKIGEALTYDYRFVQFGPEVKCNCGASNCQGYLGTKRKLNKIDVYWGAKGKRSKQRGNPFFAR